MCQGGGTPSIWDKLISPFTMSFFPIYMETNGILGPQRSVQLFLYSQKNLHFLRGFFQGRLKITEREIHHYLGEFPKRGQWSLIIWHMGFRKVHNVFGPIGIQSPDSQVDDGLGCPENHLRNARYLFRFHKTSLKRWARISRVLRRLRFSGQKRCRVPRLRRCSIMTALRQCSKICCKWS